MTELISELHNALDLPANIPRHVYPVMIPLLMEFIKKL
jgi:hypothetical protein